MKLDPTFASLINHPEPRLLLPNQQLESMTSWDPIGEAMSSNQGWHSLSKEHALAEMDINHVSCKVMFSCKW